MKTVIHVVEATATGTLSMLRLAANAQAREGCRVKVIYSIRPETPENLSDLFEKEVELINIQMGSIKEKAQALFKLRDIIKDAQPRAVFLHSSFAGFLGRIALLGMDTKVFYIPHCISFMRKDISRFKEILFILLEWFGSIKKATYVACSESEGVAIRKFIPFGSCVVVENAVDLSAWSYRGRWGERKKQVVTVGQVRMQKDPIRFASIAKGILDQRNDVEFLWVGDGDETSKKILISAGVNVLGWKTPKEVKALLEESKYYLSTALWEGMPVSPIEAMLSGCVAVLSDCAGNVDIVAPGTTGFVFNNEKQAVEQLLSLFDDEHLANSLAEAGRAYCVEQYAVERYVKEMNLLIKV
jgi:glycosyltransferase involved in cell wall biosynthesis